MAFHTRSFFVGVGTVLATMVVGFSGGVVMTNALLGRNETREPNKVEQRNADTKAAPVPIVSASSVPAPALGLGSLEQKSRPTLVNQAPVHANPPPQPEENPIDAAGSQPVQPIIIPASSAQHTPPEIKVPKRKALAERRRIERKQHAKRSRQELKQNEELDRVVERVRQVDREDHDRDPVRVRSFVAESPFELMD